MTHFDDLGLSGQALQAVAQLGYSTPTPVQEQAIPKVLEGRDLIAAAKTGTGKTAAFSLPTMDKLGHAKGNKGPLMLVVTPTRELAEQIGEMCGIIAKNTHHRILTVVGGVSYNPQIQALNRGIDVLIATPGRLVDLMDQGAAHLSSVEVLVLDEADRMLDMGFWPAMRKIIGATPQNRQTLLFSATIDRTIMNTAGKLLHDPAMVEIAHKGETADTVEQYVMHVQQAVKPELLKGLMKERGHRRVIVFCRTRSRADATCRRLKKVGYSVEAIHSSRSQNQRRRALENFANGTTDVLVATDVLARGIDVEEVEYVVNYDLPTQPEDYVHRIGRTGRAGEEGFAISFVTRETMKTLKEIEKLIGKDIPFTTIEGYETDPSVLEKPKRGERKGGARRGGNKPAGARRTGEKHAERAEREGRRPNAGEGRRRREDDALVTRGERGGRGGKGRFDRKGRNDRGGRFDRDNRNDRGGNKGGYRGKGGAGRNGEWLSDEEFRSRRNAKNAQARLHKKERKAQNGAPHKANNKKRGGEGGYDNSRFSK